MSTPAPSFKLPFKRMSPGHMLVQMEKFKQTGRIIIPQTAQRPSTAVQVLMTGPECNNAIVGDRILISQFAGYLFVFPNMPHLRVIGDNEVLGVLEPDADVPETEGV